MLGDVHNAVECIGGKEVIRERISLDKKGNIVYGKPEHFEYTPPPPGAWIYFLGNENYCLDRLVFEIEEGRVTPEMFDILNIMKKADKPLKLEEILSDTTGDKKAIQQAIIRLMGAHILRARYIPAEGKK